ncbi:hypothetical protein BpHYR1_054219 [Brachionus plicatilis]|uniref:Uncharacterized protein n=1 Tax=Brachionus plicatilis TaxID=10195 RepID=A0A3M7PYI2_BRAPC|nr:hypothetical protein BpHYR1_054219 [Brachionus plicatilis]
MLFDLAVKILQYSAKKVQQSILHYIAQDLMKDLWYRIWCDCKELPQPYGLTRLARVAWKSLSQIIIKSKTLNRFNNRRIFWTFKWKSSAFQK